MHDDPMIPRTTVIATVLATLFVAIAAPLAMAQVKVHRDLAGFTTRVGKVRITSRYGGRLRTSIPIGRYQYHGTNHGFEGITYYSSSGRFDLYWNTSGQSVHTRYFPGAASRQPLFRPYSYLLRSHALPWRQNAPVSPNIRPTIYARPPVASKRLYSPYH